MLWLRSATSCTGHLKLILYRGPRRYHNAESTSNTLIKRWHNAVGPLWASLKHVQFCTWLSGTRGNSHKIATVCHCRGSLSQNISIAGVLSNQHIRPFLVRLGGGPVQWLKLPTGKVGDRGFVPCPGIEVSKKEMFFFYAHSYSGEPPWEVAWSAGLEFWILCLEDSVILSSSGASPGPV